MITLYHFPRAICAQKVRVALAEKGLAFESRILSSQDLRSPEYLAINPRGYVPTLVHDGVIVTESRVISEYIEDAFPTVPLLPASASSRAQLRGWTKQIDDSLHFNIFVLTFVASFRKQFLARPKDAQERGLALDFAKRSVTLDLAQHGAKSGYYLDAVRRFRTLLQHMELALARSEWLVDESYSLADADFTPYLRRLQEIGFWQLTREGFPCVERWFDAVRARASYAAAILSFETDDDRRREAADIEEAKSDLRDALAV